MKNLNPTEKAEAIKIPASAANQEAGLSKVSIVDSILTTSEATCNPSTEANSDLKITEEFLSIVFPCGANTVVNFSALKNDHKPHHFRGTFTKYKDKLAELNKDGYCIYYRPSIMDGKGITDNNAVSSEWLWADHDYGLPDFKGLEPTIIVETSEGRYQSLFCLSSEASPAEVREANTGLVHFLNSDVLVINPSRLNRLPGFFNNKPKYDKPFLSKVVSYSPDNVYSLKQVLRVTSSAKPKKEKPGFGNYESKGAGLAGVKRKIKQAVMGENLSYVCFESGVMLCKKAEQTSVEEQFAHVEELLKKYHPNFSRKKALKEFSYGVTRGLLSFDESKQGRIGSTRALTKAHYLGEGYISDEIDIDKEIAKVLVVCAPTGSGKTQSLKRTVKEARRVLYIAPRVSLVENAAKSLGLLAYNDPAVRVYPNLGMVDKLAITWDSLPLLKLKDLMSYDRVIVDECDQGREHLFLGETMSSNEKRTDAVSVLAVILAQAKKVVLMSADVSDDDVRGFTELAQISEADVKKFVSTRPMDKRKVLVAEEKEALITEVENRLKNGKNCFLATDSKNESEDLAQYFRKHHPSVSILLVNSENPLPPGDINEEVSKCQLVISSPTLSTGVDINASHFHFVAGVFVAPKVSTYLGINQHINRVRYPIDKEVIVYISKRSTSTRARTEEEIWTDENIHELEHPFLAPSENLSGFVNRQPRLYESLTRQTIELHSRKDEESMFRYEKFVGLMEAQGHEVITLKPMAEEDKAEVKEELEVCAEEALENKVTEVIEATPIDYRESLRLTEKAKDRNITKEERLSLTLYFMKDAFAYEIQDDVSRELAREYLDSNLEKACDNMKIISRGLEWCKSKDREEKEKLAHEKSRYCHRHQILKEVDQALAPVISHRVFDKGILENHGFTGWLADRHKIVGKELKATLRPNYPVQAAKALLSLLMYDVEEKKEKIGGKVTRVYTVSRSPEKQDIVERIVKKAKGITEDKPFDSKGKLNDGWTLDEQGEPQQIF